MNNPVGIYEKALYKKKLPALFDDSARLGFDVFEISIDETRERLDRLLLSSDQRRALLHNAQDAGIQLFSFCFSGHRKYPMGSSDPDIEKRSMQMMEQAIYLAYDLGVRVIQVAGYDVFYEPHSEDTGKRYEENLYYSTRLAAANGIMLSIEPVETYVTSVHKAMEIIDHIHSPWLSVYPDTANLYMMGFDPVEELYMGRGHTAAVHMREAPDDDYIPYGEGKLDFPGIFTALNDIEFCGPMVIELWNEDNPDYESILTDAITFLRNGDGESCMKKKNKKLLSAL